MFDDVERLKGEFEAGEFVKVRARANVYNDRLQLIVENIRRVHLEQDRKEGFREEDCVISSARPIDEMWAELQGRVAAVGNPFIRQPARDDRRANEAKLRVWPAAQTLHHAYRAGFLEHVLQMAAVGEMLAEPTTPNGDLLLAGVLLHDIGKLQELDYDLATSYSREGRLLGHIMLGSALVREAAADHRGLPAAAAHRDPAPDPVAPRRLEFGSPVAPMTVEAFILSFVDDLDAKINMVRQAIRDDTGDSEFTALSLEARAGDLEGAAR